MAGMPDTLATGTHDGQFRITIDVPDKPNPISDATLSELDAALDDFEASAASVLSITGAGGSFATGADIHVMNEWIEAGRADELLSFVRQGQLVMDRIDQLRAPTIAAVDGYALGGGLELALACDFRFAAEGATVGFPELGLGMIPGWGGTQRLPPLVGESTAKDVLLTSRHLDAGEAAEMGLVDRVTAEGDLLDEVDDYAATLADQPDDAMGYMLDSVLAARENPMEGGLAYELLCDMLASGTDETQARIANFVEERS
jgi:enoyl-CoA hydratase/carnithine racemase